MGKILIIVGAVVVVLILAFGVSAVSSYNALFAKREAVNAAWGDVEVNLQRRADLIPQLVGAVQGALKQEQVVFGQIANARAGLTSALKSGSKDQIIDADNQLTSTLQRLQFLSITEAYPELKSNENIRDLQAQIEGTENRLRQARREYNLQVQDYNTTRGRFPTVLVASLTGFQAENSYYRSGPAAQDAPKVDLNTPPATNPAPAPAR